MKYEHGRASCISEGYRKGIEEGILQTNKRQTRRLLRWCLQKALETAKILKQLGDSAKKIMQVTGLTKEEVEAIN
ncbi:hypothetical protein HO345_08210 [Treponema denticola]|nr:hypothetical protein [Treponema denticola]UTD12962.1 hypothetical protein HO345_08210 [Treponema denticola]